MGPHEPYWRTNTSFSPPPPRWDFRFQNEGQSFGSQEGSRLYGSSTSSNSRGSRNWFRGNYLPNHRHSTSDGFGAFFSSPSELSPVQQWTPPTVQEISLDEYANSSKRVLAPLSFSPTSEGLSAPHDGRGSISSNSDSSDYDPIAKSQSYQHNFTTRGCFMSKPVHPLAFPNNPRFQDPDDNNLHSEFEFSDVSEPVESEYLNRSNAHKCNLCERFLSQRSPWSSRQIIKSGDMPVIGVLSCRHVFHAECLDQTTPKTQNGDPPCPVCAKSETKYSPDQRVSSKLKSGFPRVRPFREDGPSRPWGCVQAGNCVEGALSAQPSHNAMLLLNRNRVKKSLSLKKGGTGSSQSGGGDGVGSSKSASSSRKKL
ncbi:hypothetical protein M8C21_005422 [Ambrosia artemisiifolia]|uniref:RING-type domain-containing protein n=1 Tax=Ambrosia artemisiifolia TaxID=4212 RepID=A0AAD5GZ26_AMBAR|nr:hypothetical protein M8C21_005422 [Ambrosia artemisiifolia]